MPQRHAVVVGAGIGGLVAAIDLAVAGWAVTVVERQAAPGGKMRRVQAGAAWLDAGPTVFTMRWVFDRLFADAGAALDDYVGLHRAGILARHAWPDGSTLDLHADLDRSADAIAAFAGPAEAAGFRAFSARARRVHDILEQPFLRGGLPTPLSLARGAGVRQMLAISPFDTLMRALAEYFGDVRLRQLFGRYATYCGSSPYQRAGDADAGGACGTRRCLARGGRNACKWRRAWRGWRRRVGRRSAMAAACRGHRRRSQARPSGSRSAGGRRAAWRSGCGGGERGCVGPGGSVFRARMWPRAVPAIRKLGNGRCRR